jgi:hypothetical protein
MHNAEVSLRAPIKSAVLRLAAYLAAAIVVAGMIVLCAPRPVQATSQFATQTGLPCSQCHADLNAPAKLTDFGQAFHANGDKVPAQK